MKTLALIATFILLSGQMSLAATYTCKAYIASPDKNYEYILLQSVPSMGQDRDSLAGKSKDGKILIQVIVLKNLSHVDLSICTSPTGCNSQAPAAPADFVRSVGDFNSQKFVSLSHDVYSNSADGKVVSSGVNIECNAK